MGRDRIVIDIVQRYRGHRSSDRTVGYPPCEKGTRGKGLTRPSNKCIDPSVRLTPDLRTGSFEMCIEIAPVL